MIKKIEIEFAILSVLLLYMFFITGCMRGETITNDNKKDSSILEQRVSNYKHLTLSDSIHAIVNHSSFAGFGELLLPKDDNSVYYNIPLQNVSRLMPYHSNIKPEVVVGALNHMIDEASLGKVIFFSFYTEQQMNQDPAKRNTGIFFFRGNPGAPFAIVCPGGGFSYVGSLHEGFPIAQEISKNGYNAFVIRYRIGSEQKATEDLAAALNYIFINAEALEVTTQAYSLWGGSAGARMVGNISLNGVAAYGGHQHPKPATAVIAYTGQASYSAGFPPTFITVAENDGIASVSVVDRRVDNLRNAGVEVEYKRYKTAGHGFGTGKGTDAEGWMNEAIGFWKKHMPNH